MKKIITVLLSLFMVATMCCVNVFAEDAVNKDATTSTSGTQEYDYKNGSTSGTFVTSGSGQSFTIDQYYTVTKAAGTDDGTIDYYVTVD